MRLGLLIACVATPFVALKLLDVAFRWLTYKGDAEIVDDLIALNRAKPRGGMEAIDWQKTNRAGERTWHTTLRAQRRYATTVPPVKPGERPRVN